ncbi:hypothetical protein S245_030048, partial [Arachis hypogaea]
RKTLYKTIFPNTFHYIPINPQKTQKFYEFILGFEHQTTYLFKDKNHKNIIFTRM